MRDEMYRLMCAVRREDRSPAMQAAIAAELQAERDALFAGEWREGDRLSWLRLSYRMSQNAGDQRSASTMCHLMWIAAALRFCLARRDAENRQRFE